MPKLRKTKKGKKYEEVVPKLYKTKGKKPRYFIIVNGKRKYITIQDPKMTDEEILKYIQTYIRVRRKRKEKRKTEPILPTSPQQIISRNSILPTITPKPPLPVIPPAPGMSSQTKQDIPEVSNLLNELRLYKESDLKRKHENAKLQLEKLQLQNDIAAERLEKARLEEEKNVLHSKLQM